MEIIKEIDTLWSKLQPLRTAGRKIGFVPTMGYLHQGHLSLVKKAVKENNTVVVSIFVNPTQFGPGEDFTTYPRDMERDAGLLKDLGVDYIFAPEDREMYPEGYNTVVEVSGLTEHLCGSSRPGHFQGVTTVVTKLFNIVQPDRAYFGRKDYQQLMVIKRMTADLNLPVEIRGVPIVRETDGLALSSRNDYLDKQGRQAATVLYRALQLGKQLVEQGEKDASRIREEMKNLIEREPLARIDYAVVVDPLTLKGLEEVKDRVLLALAVYIGDIRLIDNTVIEI